MDIGSSHIKVTSIKEDLTMDVKVYPIWKSSMNANVPRISLIDATIKHILKENLRKHEHKRVNVGVVTSFEAMYPSFDHISYFTKLTEMFQSVEFYTVSQEFKSVSLEDIESWPKMSVLHALGYIASKLLDTGLLIQMNSSSTVFIPVISGQVVPLQVHYSSGIGLWIGALYTDVHLIGNETIIFGRKSLISSSFATLLDLLLKLRGEQFVKKIIVDYHSPVSITEKYLTDSSEILMKLFGVFPDMEYRNRAGIKYDLDNQTKIASLYLYSRLANIMFENVLKIISELDMSLNDLKLVLSGIGKEFILPEALHLLASQLVDIEEYVPKPYCIFLESLGVVLSLFEHVTGTTIKLDEIKWGEGI